MSSRLIKTDKFTPRSGPLLLIIMDGVGIGKPNEANAVHVAQTPNIDMLSAGSFKCSLRAHGTAVGLPTDDDMGNSEVGHNALGAGRVFDQGAKLVNAKIASGELFESPLWKEIASRKDDSNAVHFIGLLSDGNVHSHIDQLIALIRDCAEKNVKKVRVHILLDGRDVGGRTALGYIEMLENVLSDCNLAKDFDYRIASGGGRMIVTMDRYEADWDIVRTGWETHVLGKGREFKSARDAVETMYEDPEIIDQYLDPFIITDNGPVGIIEDGDSVVFFNFRGDRAIEITKAFEMGNFPYFDRVRVPNVLYVGMLEYDGDLKIPKNYLVVPPAIDNTISEYLCAEKVTSFAVSETQKFGHVTYFWNGNRSGYIDETVEKYVEIESDRIQFDKKPEMKAKEITEQTLELLRSGKYQFGRINFANGDMVGHTGTFDAAVKAVEIVDKHVGILLEEIKKLNGIALVTADHGNSDEMYKEKDGVKTPVTSHTLNPVIMSIFDPGYNGEYEMAEMEGAGLSNVAATLLNFLGYENSVGYDPSLLKFF